MQNIRQRPRPFRDVTFLKRLSISLTRDDRRSIQIAAVLARDIIQRFRAGLAPAVDRGGIDSVLQIVGIGKIEESILHASFHERWRHEERDHNKRYEFFHAEPVMSRAFVGY